MNEVVTIWTIYHKSLEAKQKRLILRTSKLSPGSNYALQACSPSSLSSHVAEGMAGGSNLLGCLASNFVRFLLCILDFSQTQEECVWSKDWADPRNMLIIWCPINLIFLNICSSEAEDLFQGGKDEDLNSKHFISAPNLCTELRKEKSLH